MGLAISTSRRNLFKGVEFVVGTGFGFSSDTIYWQAFLNNVQVGTGSATLAVGSVIGFSDAAGFDTLRYTDQAFGINAPAFDTVRAEFTSAVPEPTTWLMMLIGFAGLGFAAYRRVRPQALAV